MNHNVFSFSFIESIRQIHFRNEESKDKRRLYVVTLVDVLTDLLCILKLFFKIEIAYANISCKYNQSGKPDNGYNRFDIRQRSYISLMPCADFICIFSGRFNICGRSSINGCFSIIDIVSRSLVSIDISIRQYCFRYLYSRCTLCRKRHIIKYAESRFNTERHDKS